MHFAERKKVFHALYTHFFAAYANTEMKRIMYYLWTDVLFHWITLGMSERRLMKKFGSDKDLLRRIRKHCMESDPHFLEKCIKQREITRQKKKRK